MGSQWEFITVSALRNLRKTLDVLVFGRRRESSHMVVSCSKNPALLGKNSHAYNTKSHANNSEKVHSRYYIFGTGLELA